VSPRRRRLVASAAVGLAAVGAAVAVAAAGSSTGGPGAGEEHAGLPAAPRPALVVARPRPLPPRADEARWAPVRLRSVARTRPSAAAASVAALDTRTPEGTANLVEVLGRTAADANGALWVHVRLPILPNGSTGWVARRALGGYTVVSTHLDVDLARLRATLRSAGRVVFSAPVGVGRAAYPTPSGEFYVRNRLTRFRSPTYGPLAFGTSARSAVLTDWPAGGFVGIHGTDHPDLLPGRVSHGCIRLRNADIRRLGRLMPVGTPVTVH